MRVKARSIMLLSVVSLVALYLGSCSADDPPAPLSVTVTPPNIGTKAVTLTASAASIPADGLSSVLLTAYCTIGGEPSTNGISITFSTTKGEFSLNGVDPMGQNNPLMNVSLTTAAGYATIYLISETDPGEATVTAVFANSATATADIDFVRSNEDADDISITVNPTSGTAPLTAELEALVKGKSGDPLPGVSVRFRTSDGTANFDKIKMKTDSDGKAGTFLRNITQDAEVSATVNGLIARDFITITNDTATDVKLEVTNAIGGLAGDDPVLLNESGTLNLRATVSGDSGTVQGMTVNFSSTDPNTNFTPQSSKTNSSGEVDTLATNIRGDSIIRARTQSAEDQISVKINRKPVPVIRVIAGSADADEVSIITYSAENSYEPDQSYGDKITSYQWTYTVDSALEIAIDINKVNDQIITLTIGEYGGDVPTVDDTITVILTVTDSLGLQRTAVLTLTFE